MMESKYKVANLLLGLNLHGFILFLYFSLLSLAYYLLNYRGLLTLDMYRESFNISSLGIAFIGIFVLVILLPKSVCKISDAFNWVFAVFLLIPALVGVMFSAVSIKMILLSFGVLLVVTAASKINYAFIPKKRIPVNPLYFAWILLFCGLIPILFFGSYSGVEFTVEKIYENRELISNNQFALFEYVHPILSKAVLPFLLLVYIHKKKYLFALVILILSFSMFFLVQHRAALIYPVMVISGHYLYKYHLKNFGYFITWSIIVIVAAMIVNLFYGDFLGVGLPDFVLRRSLMVPSILQSVYLEFFTENPFTFFSDSKVTLGMIQYPYDKSVPYLIGEFIDLPQAHANAGIVGSGYQHAGIFGVFIYSMILATVMLTIDVLTPHEWKSVAFGMALPGFYWIICSSDVLSVFLTHGLIVTLLFVILLNSGRRIPIASMKRI